MLVLNESLTRKTNMNTLITETISVESSEVY